MHRCISTIPRFIDEIQPARPSLYAVGFSLAPDL